MNEMQIFSNPEFGQVRTLTIDGEPWFVGKDVAVALGYENHRDVLRKHVEDEDKGASQIATPSGKQQMTIINESGLYALIFGSKLESAKNFKRWVTHEVLPAIRKNGTYVLTQQQRELTVDDYMKAAQLAATCRNERLPYVLGFLKQAGFTIPEITKQAGITKGNEADAEEMMEILSRYTLKELCEKLAIPKTSLYYYKIGKCRPSESRRKLIVEVLG